jgi:hypothetical protein
VADTDASAAYGRVTPSSGFVRTRRIAK